MSFIWPTGSVFVPFDRKENQAEKREKWRSLDSESVSSYVSMSNPLCLQEGMKEPALWHPYSQVPHLQWAHRGMEGESKVRGTDGGNNRRTHWMWRRLTDKQTHSHSSPNKEKKKPEKAEIWGRRKQGFCTGAAGMKENWGFWENWCWKEGWRAQHRS